MSPISVTCELRADDDDAGCWDEVVQEGENGDNRLLMYKSTLVDL
jgi:hypothetical protein